MPISAAQSQCPDGWSFFEGSCYYIGAEGYDFLEARRYCDSVDGELALISSSKENAFIMSLLQNDNATGAWIGLGLYRRSGKLEWRGLHWSYTVSFSNWTVTDQKTQAAIAASQRSRNIRCAALGNQHDWAWEARDCDVGDGMKFVCKSCALQQICTDRTCFRLLCVAESYSTTKRICENLGGSLASVRTEEESDAIKDFLNQASMPRDRSWAHYRPTVYLAGSYDRTEGDWYWYTTGQRENISSGFTDWSDSEPNNCGIGCTKENCMAMSANQDWKWTDVRCHTRRAALCEI
ncbi:macrophage mannose receptor 1 [Plakobranchus ocellatus]|uniref:Macrophage mannose receptor 1 n=1 Tax=Plakobranchus ocellatus TaxID=259542 RepID=A0AAV4DNH7_9GAST|nr:macrophage mannose receptor 1 [Plakobranchus ocellatus]